MNNLKIAIANSVGVDEEGNYFIHSPSRWTNSSKNPKIFTYYPWQLSYASSLLKRETNHTVKFFDGCLNKWDVEQYYERLKEFDPDIIVMEPSTRTYLTDKKLLEKLKENSSIKIILTGQHASAFPETVSELADYVCIGEYEYTVLDIVKGKARKEIKGLYPNPRRELLDINTLPFPEDDDVSRLAYGDPGEPSSAYLEVQMYASRGCPIQCNFCVCANLYYNKPNWRPRNIDSIIQELKYLVKKYPQMQGIFFDEEVHNGTKRFIKELTGAIIENKLNFLKYEAMCGYFTMDREMLERMKEAGYYMCRIGIETASERTAEQAGMKKKYNLEKLYSVLEIAREIDMKIYGTFTFGALGSSYEDDKKTIALIKDLIEKKLLWKFQLSINTPQPGTPFYNYVKNKGYLRIFDFEKYDGGNSAVVSYPDYTDKQIEENYNEATKLYGLAQQYQVKDNIDKILKEITINSNKRYENILMFRTARPWQVDYIYKALIKNFSGNIDLIAQKDYIPENKYKEIYRFDSPFICMESIKPIINKLNEKNYDLIIIPSNNTSIRGYENINEILKVLKFKKAFYITTEKSIMAPH